MITQIRLILTTKQDSHLPSSSKNSGETTKLSNFKFLAEAAYFVALILFLGFLLPAKATAESSITEGGQAVSSPASGQNSQTIDLLQSSAIPDLTAGTGGANIFTDNGALMPEVGPLGTAADNVEIPDSGDISLYVVRKGDTLSNIAKIYNVSVNTIIWANELKKGEALKENQVLVILPVTGLRHEIKKGDTIESIAKKYRGDISDILTFNGLAPEAKLTIGDVIIIPDGELSITETSYTVNKTTKKGERVYGTDAPEYAGYYIRPISGGRKTQGLHGFNGVDLAAPTGTPIVASASGDVILVRGGWGGGYGNYIIIAHDNGTKTLYAHNSQNLVTVGERVKQGQTIALVGSTGRSTGPHVHFEVRGAKNPF